MVLAHDEARKSSVAGLFLGFVSRTALIAYHIWFELFSLIPVLLRENTKFIIWYHPRLLFLVLWLFFSIPPPPGHSFHKHCLPEQACTICFTENLQTTLTKHKWFSVLHYIFENMILQFFSRDDRVILTPTPWSHLLCIFLPSWLYSLEQIMYPSLMTQPTQGWEVG